MEEFRLHDVTRFDVEDAWSLFGDTLVDSFRSARGVVKVSQRKKETEWWDEKADEALKEKEKLWLNES